MSQKYQPGKWYRINLSDDIDDEIPWGLNYPGVYLIFNDHKECLYVGQSSNLGKRLRTHIRLSLHSSLWQTSWRRKGYRELIIAFRIDKKKFERLTLEARLIYRIQPKYNTLSWENH